MKRRAVLCGFAGLAGTTALPGCALFAPDESTATSVTPSQPRQPRSTLDGRSADAPTPYRDVVADNHVYRPRAVRVTNETRRERYVTVAVDEGDRMVALRNATVSPGATVSHVDVVAKRGVYAVTVDTDVGESAVREFVVSEGISDLDVVLRPEGITTRQEARCWPDCPPVSSGGFAADFPRPETIVQWHGFGQLLVRNVDVRTRRVRVQLWTSAESSSERLLDYRYRVSAGMQLVIPLVAEAEDYVVAVSVSDRTVQREWHVPEESVAEFEVGERVDAVCDLISGRTTLPYGPFRFRAVENHDDVAHQVFVAVHHRGSVALDEFYVVEPGESVEVNFETATLYDIELVARTDEGEDLVATWNHCPPAGDLVLTIDERGRLRTYSDRQGLVGAPAVATSTATPRTESEQSDAT